VSKPVIREHTAWIKLSDPPDYLVLFVGGHLIRTLPACGLPLWCVQVQSSAWPNVQIQGPLGLRAILSNSVIGW